MYLSLSSHATMRLLAAIRSGEGIKKSARLSGIPSSSVYRLLRDRYLQLRRGGMSGPEAVLEMGVRSSRVEEWEAQVAHPRLYHQRALPVEVEDRFWAALEGAMAAAAVSREAGIPHVTGQRWVQRRFDQLRGERVRVGECARRLSLRTARAEAFEMQRLAGPRARRSVEAAAQREALFTAARHAEQAIALHGKLRRRKELAAECWRLMRQRVTNVEVCRILGVSRQYGIRLRQNPPRLSPHAAAAGGPGRYLELRERVLIGPAPGRVLDASDRGAAGPLGLHDQQRAGPARRPGRQLLAGHRGSRRAPATRAPEDAEAPRQCATAATRAAQA
ncbi:MAG TPA: hypothetical protein VHB92_14435 [Humibacter sp.]|jgi:hypothetical protein|nr:hypothetical protein [Humibacter sp.]HVX09120.1 hypothetical protein [Humibacter sp.]